MYCTRTRSVSSTDAEANVDAPVETLVRIGMIDWLKSWFTPLVKIAEPTPAAAELAAAVPPIGGVPATPTPLLGDGSPNARIASSSLSGFGGLLVSVSFTSLAVPPT